MSEVHRWRLMTTGNKRLHRNFVSQTQLCCVRKINFRHGSCFHSQKFRRTSWLKLVSSFSGAQSFFRTSSVFWRASKFLTCSLTRCCGTLDLKGLRDLTPALEDVESLDARLNWELVLSPVGFEGTLGISSGTAVDLEWIDASTEFMNPSSLRSQECMLFLFVS